MTEKTEHDETPTLEQIREKIEGLIEIMDYEDIPPQAAMYSVMINLVHLLTNLVKQEAGE